MSESTVPLTDPETGRPLPKCVQPGYYPGWNVMTQRAYWDDATRTLVEKRLSESKPVRFFTADEASTMTAVLDRILPQEDRLPAQRIPLLPSLDERLYVNRIEGYRYEDMPSDRQAYRWAAEAFEAMAQEMYGLPFTKITVTSQEVLLTSLHDGAPVAAKELWKRMNVDRFWSLLVSDASTAYYAHPWAWNEVGFGGPAYPRGYMRLEEGEPEPWEVGEQRYEWAPPADTLSDESKQVSGREHMTHHGQAGTH